jgi:hypothetical protein
MSSQQSLLGRPFAVLVLSAISWPLLKQHLPAIMEAIENAVPGTVAKVDCGKFVARPRSGPR